MPFNSPLIMLDVCRCSTTICFCLCFTLIHPYIIYSHLYISYHSAKLVNHLCVYLQCMKHSFIEGNLVAQVPWSSICPCPATITALSTLGHSHAINEVLKYYSSFQLSINHSFIPMSLYDLTDNYPSIPSLIHPSTHHLWMLCLDLSVTLQAVDSLTYIFSVFSQPTVDRTVSIQSQPVLPQNSSCA